MSARSRIWTFVPHTVLVLIILVQILRQAWPDLTFFVVALLAVISHSHGSRSRWAMPELSPLLVAGIAVVVGVAVIAAPPHSTVIFVTVCAVGVATAIVAVWGGANGGDAEPQRSLPTGRQSRRPMRRAILAWSAIVVAAGVWELTAFIVDTYSATGDGVMPSITDLVEPLVAEWPGKTVFAVIWLIGGAALLRRAATVRVRAPVRQEQT